MLGPKDLWADQAQGYPPNGTRRESGETDGGECFGILARPNADLERDHGLVPTAQ
jgi:hypothetical protein